MPGKSKVKRCKICSRTKTPRVCKHSKKDQEYFESVYKQFFSSQPVLYKKDFIRPLTMNLCLNCNNWHTELKLEDFSWLLKEKENVELTSNEENQKNYHEQLSSIVKTHYLSPDAEKRKRCFLSLLDEMSVDDLRKNFKAPSVKEF